MKITTFEDLVKQINSDLGPFCDKFLRMRETLSGKQPKKLGILFAYNEKYPNWAKNMGGGTEIQYQIDFHNETIRFGLGFNAIYVRYNNDCSPVDYIKPFVNAYFELKNTALVSSLKSNGYEFIIGSEEELRNIQVGKYYLFGKKIAITNNEISDEDYRVMIEDIKGPLYKLYCAIFERKNENERNSQRRSEEMQKIQNYVNLLLNSHNIILHGAPGTGKTYLARQIAESMGAETCFVQFHPSYDYTDFVEGLRPVNKEGSKEIGFERKDGIFKTFCKKALLSTFINTVDNFEDSWKNLCEILSNKERIDIPLIKDKTKTIKIELNSFEDGLRSCEESPKFFNREQLYKIYKGLPGVPSGGHDTYRKAIVKYMKEECGLEDYNQGEQKVSDKNFVFIIDEINRGEMSKIFGELFFSIDPGYRGEKGKISTQYQNLLDEGDAFYDGFYVPENVYIIGTMNDIDRNVESMDFAIRRRFAFKEITALDTQDMLDNHNWGENKPDIEAMKKRMTNLNNAISGIEGLSSAYHIGAAYFLKYDSSKDEATAFDELWDYHLKPLLQEYLRGMDGAEQKLKDLEAAYNLQKQYDENGKEFSFD